MYHLTSVRMSIIKKSTNNKCWRGSREKRTLQQCSWECKMVQPLWRKVWRSLKKLKIELPYDPAIWLLGIYLEKNIIQKITCTTMITAALFTRAKTWKQPKCPSTEEWIKNCYIYTIEHCCCCSVAKLCPALCSLLGCSTPRFPVTVSQSLLRFKSIELVMLFNHYSAIKKN